jgi:hypothetical protein
MTNVISKSIQSAQSSLPAAVKSPTTPSVFLKMPMRSEILETTDDELPALKDLIARALKPIEPLRCKKCVSYLFTQIPKMPATMNDPESASAFAAGMVEEMCIFPEDAIDEAIRRARRKYKFMPSIAEMVELIEGIMKPRRRAKRDLADRLLFGRPMIETIPGSYLPAQTEKENR